jgi:cytochrome b
MTAGTSAMVRTTPVWDRLVRAGHWLLVSSVLGAWLTRHTPGPWHEWLGYGSLAVIAVRIIWGWCGSYHARFANFVRGPRATLSYAHAVLAGREAPTLGHNPLGAWMIVALILVVVLVCVSGWLYTTDRFWGVQWVETLHSKLTDVLLVLATLHVAGVLYASWRHRENLVAAMVHGRKRGDAAPSD